MFNVTILKMKDIKKYLAGMIITIIIVMMISKYFQKITDKSKTIHKSLVNNNMIECLERTVPATAVMELDNNLENKESQINSNNILQEMLKKQIASLDNIDMEEENLDNENNIQVEKEKEEKVEMQEVLSTEKDANLAKTEVTTEVITKNPLKDSYTDTYGAVKIKNETDYQLTR